MTDPVAIDIIDKLRTALQEILDGPPATEDEPERAIVKMRSIAREALEESYKREH